MRCNRVGVLCIEKIKGRDGIIRGYGRTPAAPAAAVRSEVFVFWKKMPLPTHTLYSAAASQNNASSTLLPRVSKPPARKVPPRTTLYGALWMLRSTASLAPRTDVFLV